MIPQIKCINHSDEDVVLLDISKEPPRKNRIYCFECLNEAQPKKTIQIKKIPDQATLYCNKTIEEIKEEYDPLISKINKIKQTLSTMNKKIISCFDEMLMKCEKILNEFIDLMFQEQESYTNIQKTVTRTKLELIGDILSGNHQRESKFTQNRNQCQNLAGEIAIVFNSLIIDQQEAIIEIRQELMNQIKCISKVKQEQGCYVLSFNQTHNTIVGGRGKDIIIWQQNQLKLKEISVLKSHIDFVFAIAIYQSGDMIVSGGGANDKSIKLWRQYDNQWNCIQTINDHKERITDLQLSQNQKYLVSSSVDKLIKIWIMKQPDYQLECIQTIDDHQNFVFWITISSDSMQMASSSSQNYSNIYKNEQTQINPWKKFNKLVTKGSIHRIYYTNNDELLVQQENPSILIVYQKDQNDQYQPIQDIILNEPDNNEILFPIFQIKNTIYLKNDKFVYVISRLVIGKFYIQQILQKRRLSGCRDCSGEGIILWNAINKSIETYK